MTKSQGIPLSNAAKMIGIAAPKLRKMAEKGQVNGFLNENGRWKFQLEDISELNPSLLDDKFMISQSYRRPHKVVKAAIDRRFRGMNVFYRRNAKSALAITAGLPLDLRGALLMMIDLMALHEGKGIPADKHYIGGVLRIGSRKWTQTIEPGLIEAEKIKKVRRGSEDVYIWADPDMIEGPRRVIDFLFDENEGEGDLPPEAPFYVDTPDDKDFSQPESELIGATEMLVELQKEDEKSQNDTSAGDRWGAGNFTGDDVAREVASDPPPKAMMDEAKDSTRDATGIAKPANEEIIPAVSAYEVLERAGIDVEGHPRGPFFWARAEHKEVLDRWLQAVPLNEIIARLAKAKQAGKIEDHLNNLGAYERYVMET